VRRLSPALFLWFIAVPGFGDERTQRMLARLAEEAVNFERIAINLVSEETLYQTAVKDNKQKRKDPKVETPKEWVYRQIKSEYVFATLGEPKSIREVRKVVSVDGKPTGDPVRALDQLLQTVQSGNEQARRRLLEDFEKHGLIGTVTDFGQLLLLFARPNQEGYLYKFVSESYLGADLCHLFTYEQQEGRGALTVYSDSGMQQPRIGGEIWLRAKDYTLMRMKLRSNRSEKGSKVREEGQVDYVPAHGALVPSLVIHHQYRDGALTTENRFHYSEFREARR
jgi:hypothetical protein